MGKLGVCELLIVLDLVQGGSRGQGALLDGTAEFAMGCGVLWTWSLCHCGLPAAAVRKMFSAFCPVKTLDWIWTTLTT